MLFLIQLKYYIKRCAMKRENNDKAIIKTSNKDDKKGFVKNYYLIKLFQSF